MNDSRLGITGENLLRILPPALTQDPSMVALASAGAEALAARRVEIDRVRTISNIDGLEEAVLDILAHDFKVDWYDPEYSLEEKRRTLKGNWLIHRRLGTKYAVRTALNAVYPGTIVQEWFEYGGNPYCFRVVLPAVGELTIEESAFSSGQDRGAGGGCRPRPNGLREPSDRLSYGHQRLRGADHTARRIAGFGRKLGAGHRMGQRSQVSEDVPALGHRTDNAAA